jgi:hypothetical protein
VFRVLWALDGRLDRARGWELPGSFGGFEGSPKQRRKLVGDAHGKRKC